MRAEVSVVIPTYNRARLVVRSIESALAQTHPPHEIVVIDDGSSDDTCQTLRSYAERTPAARAIQYIVQEHAGKSAALNNAMARSCGEWIAFLDSDDVWWPEKLEWQLRALERFGGKCAACFTDARFVNDPSLIDTAFGKWRDRYTEEIDEIENAAEFIVSLRHNVMIQSLIVRKDLAVAAGGFDEHLFLGEDWDFLLRVGLLTSFCYVNKILVDVDRTPSRQVGLVELLNVENVRLQQKQIRYEKWLETCQGREHLTRLISNRLLSTHSQWANLFLSRGDYDAARRSMNMTLKYNPGPGTICKWLLTQVSPRLARAAVGWRQTH